MSGGLTCRSHLHVLSLPFTGTELIKHSDYPSSTEKEIGTQRCKEASWEVYAVTVPTSPNYYFLVEDH